MSKILLCDKIESAPLSSVKNIDNGIVTFFNSSNGFSPIEELVAASLTETGSESVAGTLVNQSLDIKCQIPINSYNALINEPRIFRLRFSDGRVQIWGSLTNKIQLSISKRELNSTQVVFERKSQVFEF